MRIKKGTILLKSPISYIYTAMDCPNSLSLAGFATISCREQTDWSVFIQTHSFECMYVILSHQKLPNYIHVHIQGAKDSNNILSPIDIIHYRKSHQSTVRVLKGLHPPQPNVQTDKNNNMRDTIQFQQTQIIYSS